jgi:mono/diheme cytochrome c family protein
MVNARILIWLLVLGLVVVACGSQEDPAEPAAVTQSTPDTAEATPGSGIEPIQGMGPGSGMMARHHATIPEPYRGRANPVPADQTSLDRGAELYSTLCASCHGDGGMGDGPAGAGLDPAPAPVAHTSQMMGDDMLFWRISEGGGMAPFNSAMPAWNDALDEQARWDLINYVRALGRGQVAPRRAAGGGTFDPAAELAARAEMLATGVELGVINQIEADLFAEVHSAMDAHTAANASPRVGGMDQMRLALLDELVAQGTITGEQADAFNDIHDRLVEAGVME